MAEKTFRWYTHEQGVKYAEGRLAYSPDIYKVILRHHTSTGGQLGTILDAGCGPGNAVRELASNFRHGIGLDASEGMISTARALGGSTSTGEPIRFECSSAESLGSELTPPIPDSSIDLITVASAAHWFDMPRFWPAVARVLKRGGTIAIWAGAGWEVHPSTPNYQALQAAMDRHEAHFLAPYMEPGNVVTRNLYVDLQLPWTIEGPVAELDEDSFYCARWGVEKDDQTEDEKLLSKTLSIDLKGVEALVATMSPMQRWREANPEKVGTEEDAVAIVMRDLARLFHEAGVEKGEEVLTSNVKGALLMIKRK